MKVSLVVAHGAHQGKEIPIKQAQLVIGRDPECQLRPASPMISRRHCAVLVREGKVWLRDFGSTNGTQLNGQRVQGEVELHDGDTLKADPLVFTVRIEAPAPAKKSKPTADPMEDDSIAALLLEGSEEGTSAASALDTADEPVPLGTTVLQVPALAEGEPDPQAAAKPAAPKKEEPKPVENTSAAAKLLLDKYTRRKRP
jgi:pSer/pThr/pTyr-binding forkhead associated (FHA) protein